HALEDLALCRRGYVMQDIEDDYGIGAAEHGTADVALYHLAPRPECAARPVDLAPHQLYAAHRFGAGCRWPGPRPVPALIAAVLGGPQPGSEQSLTASQVEDAPVPAQQAEFQDRAEYRVAAQLAARKVIREAVGLAIRLAGLIEQRAAQQPPVAVPNCAAHVTAC